MSARVAVRRAGPLATVQDAGRPGWARYGVPPSGPVDRLAAAAALAAVGADAHHPLIELAAGGIELVGESGEIGFALTGAGVAELDGARLGGWTMSTLRPGERLQVRVSGGNWAYLGLAGRLVARAWLDSVATHALLGLGGGRIAVGQMLEVEDARSLAMRAFAPPPDTAPITEVRVVPGPQEHWFGTGALATLTAAPFAATAALNRMGMMLSGPPIRPTRVDMASEPVVRGALQANGEGALTLLLADYQTTGGYPKIAVALPRDADRVAQLPAGTPIRFRAVTPAEAVAATRGQAGAERAYLETVARAESLTDRLWTRNVVTALVRED